MPGQEFTYKDGSVQKIQIDNAEIQVLGAAAVDALTSRTLYIDVNGGTNGCQTITRCELSTIHKGFKVRQEDGLYEETVTIWKDSAASLFLISHTNFNTANIKTY
jgi:hypothetical protein